MCPLFSGKISLLVGVALLTTATPLRAGESARGQELRHRLSDIVDFPGIEDARATLNDALDQLSKRYGLTFDINEEAFKKAKRKKDKEAKHKKDKEANLKEEVGRTEIAQPTPIPPMRTNLARILRKILRRVPHSATYLIRGDLIEITTTEAIRKEFFADRPATPRPLPPLVSGVFDKVPLESALKKLNDYGNVVLDARVEKEGQMPVSADLANVPLDTTVRMFADMAGLAVVPLDNALYVTSKDNARALREEREKSNAGKKDHPNCKCQRSCCCAR